MKKIKNYLKVDNWLSKYYILEKNKEDQYTNLLYNDLDYRNSFFKVYLFY